MAPTGTVFTVTTLDDDPCPNFGTVTEVCPISLRCAIERANLLVAGTATIAFNIPDADCTGGICTIALDSQLAPITVQTIINGKTQTNNQGTTNPNGAAHYPPGGSVGVLPAVVIPDFDPPEIEITVAGNATQIPFGLLVEAPMVSISNIAIWGFGTDTLPTNIFTSGANIALQPNSALPAVQVSMTVENCVIGARASDAFTDPRNPLNAKPLPPPVVGPAAETMNVQVKSGAGTVLRHNIISFGTVGVGVADSVQLLVEENHIDSNDMWGIALAGPATTLAQVLTNLITNNGFAGFDAGPIEGNPSGGQHTIRQNTIAANGPPAAPMVAKPAPGDLVPSTPGVQLWGVGNVVERNLIAANAGAGVQVTVNSTTNQITRNSIFLNGSGAADGQIGIDLHVGAEDPATGTPPYVTPNASNGSRVDFPVFTRVNVIDIDPMSPGGTHRLELAGTTVNGARVEVFIANVNPLVPGDEGEGMTLIHEFTESTLDLDGDFAENIALPAGVSRGTIIVATATVTGDTSEFSANATATSFADLGVTLVDSPDPVGVSDTLTYTATVTNRAGSDVDTVNVLVALDGNLTAQAGSGTNWTCQPATGNDLLCTLSTLASGTSSVLTITAKAPATVQALSSTVSIDPSTPYEEPPGVEDMLEETATATTTMTADDNLTVALDIDPNPTNIDDPLTYTITVSNPARASGTTAQATDVVVDLTLPAQTTPVLPIVVFGWTCTVNSLTPSTVVCTPDGNAPVLVDSAPVVITVLANAPSLAGTYPVSAHASSFDNNVEPVVSTVNLMVGSVIDLAVRIIDRPSPAPTGALVTYTLIVTNRGPDRSSPSQLIVTLPVNSTFNSATAVSCDQAQSGGQIGCDVGVLEPGTSQQFSVTVTAQNVPGNLALDAEVFPGAQNADTVAENNIAHSITRVTDQADLVLSITSPAQVTTSGQFVTALTIANLGVKDAPNVTAIYTLPAGATYVSFTGTGWDCSNVTTTVTCTRGSLNSLVVTVIQIVALAPSTVGMFNLMASVDSDAAEDATSNNSDVAVLNVVSPQGTADPSVTLAGAPNPVDLGGTVTFTITAANAGPDPAPNATVRLDLDTATYVSAAPGAGWTCGPPTDGVVECTNPSLAAAASSVITVVATAPDQAGTITATANISSLATNTNTTNDIASVSIVVAPTADLSVAITAAPEPVRGSTALTYTATVSNAGPSNATGAQAVITLGAGAVFQSVNGGLTWTCANAGQLVTCTDDSVDPGSTTITVVATAPSGAGTLTTNIAVTSTSNDPTPANNTAMVVSNVTAANACTMDSDCGSATSGRVCDALTCVNGCRGMGGNGCPPGQLCSSTTTGIGMCLGVAPPDAGVFDARTSDAGATDAAINDARVIDAGAGAIDAPQFDAAAGSLEGAGCSCTTGRSRSDVPFGGLLLAAAGMLLVIRRRKR